jgi:methyl-accepting chemotaxis protein
MLNRLKIRTKLLVSFILVALIAGIIGLFSIKSLDTLSDADTNMYQNVAVSLGYTTKVATTFQAIRVIVRDEYLAKDAQELSKYLDRFHVLEKDFDENIVALKGTALDDTDKKNCDAIERAKNKYMSYFPEFEKLLAKNDKEAAYTLMRGDWFTANETLQNAIDVTVQYNIESGKKMADENVSLARTASFSMSIMIAIGIVLAIILGLLISSNIQKIINSVIEQTKKLIDAAVAGRLTTRANAEETNVEFREIVVGINQTLDAVITPLNVAAEYVDKISKGDMPGLITDNYNGDFNNIKNNINTLINSFNEIITKAKMVSQGDLTVTLAKRSENDELMGALSDMVSRLSEIVAQVMEAAQNVAISSNEMSTSAIQISEGANEQSASAEEVSSSIEEMASAIQQNSDNSISTEKIAVASAQGIMDVNNSAQKSLEAIRQISEKIKIINDIAGKTDILAINAAIEAARAGEQGKGFAVVAAEVRKLAEVSQKAAVEINELSSSSLKVTEESGSLMMKIIPEIQKTAQLVKEIAASSNEQRSGSEQITKAVIQFTQVTQQNAAAAEEMSSSSEELANQAELLKETISFFNTGKQMKQVQPVKSATKAGKSRSVIKVAATEHNPGIHVKLDGNDKSDMMFENY